jgi:hypothetical protein
VKSTLSGLLVALGVSAVAASAAPAPPPAMPPKLSRWQQAQQEMFHNSAPADEYFGTMKLSYLGMNNTFRDAAISSGDHTTDPGIISKVSFAENALEAWADKYPHDPQLARTYFLATQVERKIWTKDAQDRAWVNLNRLVKQFPATYFGKLLAKDLAIGFTEHYYALPVPCDTPPPAATPIPYLFDAGPDDVPTPEPAPTPVWTPAPTPSPIETTVTTGLRSEIIAQACVPPATPSPSPSPSPFTSASPSDSATAAATETPAATPVPAVTPSP